MHSETNLISPAGRSKSGPLVIVAVTAVMALVFGIIARFDDTKARWTDHRSATFVLREGVSGSWSERWKRCPGHHRDREVWLFPTPWRDNDVGLGASILIHVEPHEAILSSPSVASDGEWYPIQSSRDDQGKSQPVLTVDPELVHRIDYRVASVDASFRDTSVQLYVAGTQDSDSPVGLFFWAAGALIFLFGTLPSLVWYRLAKSGSSPVDAAIVNVA